MKSVQNTAYVFQKRRAKAWRSALPWFVPMAIGLTGSFYIDEFSEPYPPLARLSYLVRDHYLCPVCETVPKAPESAFGGGIDLNPKLCPNCGAKLK